MEFILLVTLASVLMFVVSIAVTPWLLVRLPADYFQHPKPHLLERLREVSKGRAVLIVAKNALGVALVLAGIAMLVLPGQGLLTMLVGIFLVDFPRKQQLERRILTLPKVHQTIDWLRKKYGKPPLEL